MFDKTFHPRLDNMTRINIGGTWHPVTDVSHVKRGTGCVVNLTQLFMYFRVHWKMVQFKFALVQNYINIHCNCTKDFLNIKVTLWFIGGFKLETPCSFSGQNNI